MRILYLVTQSESGGAQKYCLDLAKNLKKEHEIFGAGGEQKDGWLFQELAQAKIPFVFLKHLLQLLLEILFS